MKNQQVILYSYDHTISWEEGFNKHWSDTVETSVTIKDYALSSGWIREQFCSRRGGATDFVVLLSILMHARPISEEDLQYLVGLHMAVPEDKGRMYARVTDLGLSKELGIHRITISESIQRLSAKGLLNAVEIPGFISHFQDSHGRYNGTRVYLLAGDLKENFLTKNIVFSNIESRNGRKAQSTINQDCSHDRMDNSYGAISSVTAGGTFHTDCINDRLDVSFQP
jgi:hypothetical protein